jgi:hypothetical protein
MAQDQKIPTFKYSRGTEVLVTFGCRCNTKFVWEHHTKSETPHKIRNTQIMTLKIRLHTPEE